MFEGMIVAVLVMFVMLLFGRKIVMWWTGINEVTKLIRAQSNMLYQIHIKKNDEYTSEEKKKIFSSINKGVEES